VLGVRLCSFTVGDLYRTVHPRLEAIVVGPLDVPVWGLHQLPDAPLFHYGYFT
jgi:hypothetical protein